MAAAKESDNPHPRWACCFADEDDVAGFRRAFNDSISALNRAATRRFVSQENQHSFAHGGRWIHPASKHGDKETNMQSMSAAHEVRMQDIVDNNLAILPASLTNVSEELSKQFATAIYARISEAAENAGNVTSGKDKSLSQAWLEALQMVEFGVDREGNVSIPEFHVGPDLGDRLLKELESQPPEFAAEVERVKAEKSEAALERERRRKAQFRSPS